MMVIKDKKNGFSLILLIVIVGITAIVSAGVITIAQQFLKMQNQNNHRMMAMQIKDELKKIISDQGAWSKTIADTVVNPTATSNFGCLVTAGDCTGIASPTPVYSFVPKTITNGLFRGGYNPNVNPTQGFTVDGQLCNTFTAPPAVANTNCVFRYTFTWAPDCSTFPPGNCRNPPVFISITFIHNPLPGTIRLSSDEGDPNSISQTFVRGFEFDNLSLQTICAARGPGVTYNPTTKRCVVPASPPPPPPPPPPAPIIIVSPPPCTASSCSDMRVKKDIETYSAGLSEVFSVRLQTNPYDIENNKISMMVVNSIKELNSRLDKLEIENRILKQKVMANKKVQ